MEQLITQLEAFSFLGNTGWQWSVALTLLIGTTLLIKLFKLVIIARLKKLAAKTVTDIDDIAVEIIDGIGKGFYTITSLYVAVKFLSVADVVGKAADLIFIVMLVFEVIKAITTVINFFARKYLDSEEGGGDGNKQNDALVNILRIVAKVFLWLIGLTVILSYLGIDITSIVASLGIGGLAVALAVQNILSDIFSSFSIYLDKPFEIGDFVVLGKDSGTVEKIGLKSTRLRALSGEELVISNKELTAARIQNYKRMKKRRVAFMLGVTYETSHKLLKAFPRIVKEEVKAVAETQWYNCYFKNYGQSSLDYEVIFFVKSGDFEKYMKIIEKVNLAIFKRAEKEGISFAYPTRTIHLDK
ncbi:MAG: mechanosensitive ion channel protein MscS [Parcubacteria group bacterium]|nr:mechanosensitive ion channel protein MscS [Parcubacteria group bacterium]